MDRVGVGDDGSLAFRNASQYWPPSAGCVAPLALGAAATAPQVVRAVTGPVVIATTSIWANVTDQLDCTDTFDVRTLVPVGGDPHEYEPSMRDRERLDDAALVVANGAGLEALLTDTLDAAAGDGTPVYTVADHVDTHPIGDGTATSDDGGARVTTRTSGSTPRS